MRIFNTALVLLLAAPALLCAAEPPAQSSEPATDPKWQAGVFLGYVRLPHFRGSDEYKDYIVPIPFFVYRGDVVKTGRGGVRGVFFNNVRFDASVSMSGNPPVGSDDDAREGMPELPPLIEAGPALKWWPFGKLDSATLYVELAARATASVDVRDDFGVAYQGWRSELSLNYRKEFPAADGKNWKVGGALSCYAASGRYYRYFYDVPDRYATDERPAYDSEGGYGGSGISAFVSRRLNPRLVCALFGRVDNISGAAFADSPLVNEQNNLTVGAALIWTLAQSEKRVPRDPTEGGD